MGRQAEGTNASTCYPWRIMNCWKIMMREMRCKLVRSTNLFSTLSIALSLSPFHLFLHNLNVILMLLSSALQPPFRIRSLQFQTHDVSLTVWKYLELCKCVVSRIIWGVIVNSLPSLIKAIRYITTFISIFVCKTVLLMMPHRAAWTRVLADCS